MTTEKWLGHIEALSEHVIMNESALLCSFFSPTVLAAVYTHRKHIGKRTKEGQIVEVKVIEAEMKDSPPLW